MERETCRRFRWFWAWQDDREEEWLGAMSRNGWHLMELGLPGFYTFKKGEPEDFVYRLDFQTARMKDRDAYLQLFRDAGWEHLGHISSWEYFRKEAGPGEQPEIFTDPESKIEKYRRVLRFLLVFFPILIVLESSGWNHLRYGGIPGWAVMVVTAAVIFLFPIAIIKIGLRIRKLKTMVRR